jgi:hypothetical protein
MDDRAGTGIDHRRHQRPVETHGGQQVHVQLVCPILLVEGRKAARRRAGSAGDMDDDLRSPAAPNMFGDGVDPGGGADVRADEVVDPES